MVPNIWGTRLEICLQIVQGRRRCNLIKEQDPFVHGRMKSPNTSSQGIELGPSCSKKSQSNRPNTDYKYESTEPGYILTILRVPSIFSPLVRADANSQSCMVFPCNCHKPASKS